MAETTQMNLNVMTITRERVKRIAQDTFRNPGDVIDWLVDEAYKRMYPHNGNLMDILAPAEEKGEQS
jgi:hypothetical protein